MSFLRTTTIVPANITFESKVLTGIQTLAAAKAAYDNPRQFTAAATVALLLGIARGIFELKNHQAAIAAGKTDKEAKALAGLNPLPDRKVIAFALLLLGCKAFKIREIHPKYLNWTELSAVPMGYSVGVCVAREVMSRFLIRDEQQRQVLLAGLRLQLL